MEAPGERAGVVRDEKTGELFIPASRRPDGTWRKARKVKDGYIPQEEVPVYETKGVQWMKSRSNLPPGLNFVEDEKPKDGAVLSKSAKKKLKQKEKKKQAAATSEVQELTNSVKSISLSASGAENEATSSKGQCSQGASQEDAQVVDPEKKLKNLKKKLRQIEGLEAKINSGELKNPETAQLEKVAKKQEVIDAIEDLELELADI